MCQMKKISKDKNKVFYDSFELEFELKFNSIRLNNKIDKLN